MAKKIIRKLLPRRVYRRIKLWVGLKRAWPYMKRDMDRYLRQSAAVLPCETLGRHEAMIMILAHAIEKGLSLQERRTGFGREKVARLIELLRSYRRRGYSTDKVFYRAALSALAAYARFHRGEGYDLGGLGKEIDEIAGGAEDDFGGTREVTREEILRSAASGFARFNEGRASVRSFGDEPVDLDLLMNAVRLARKSPSMCNRQSVRVYAVRDREVRQRALEHQSGNRGFGHRMGLLLVIASDLQMYTGLHERHGAWVDGGIFTMSLLNGLHHEGLGACALNFAATPDEDRELRRVVGVRDEEVVICLIAVGSLPETLRVPRSPRREVDEIVTVV